MTTKIEWMPANYRDSSGALPKGFVIGFIRDPVYGHMVECTVRVTEYRPEFREDHGFCI